jgi:Heterokaryon incompatibility protein (HET)
VYSTSSLNLFKPELKTSAPKHPINEEGLFSYRPLRNHREIRLLELFPGDEDMPLEGVIRYTSLDSPGKYWAIFYAWGAALQPFYFQTPEGKISLTVSMYAALQSVRDKEHSILLWADAICIGQGNPLEKRIQIRLMRIIFQSAERVVAWLSEEKDNSHQAIEALLQIRIVSLKPGTWPESLPAIPVSWGGRDIPSLRDSTWRDIDLLLSRSWFRRSWIVQELILASNVIINCGRWTLSWNDLFEGLKICRGKLQSEAHSGSDQVPVISHADPAFALGRTRESRIKFHDAIFGRRYNLLELLDLFSYTEATQDRDKTFALLGLATDCTGEAFDPDYESTMEDVIRRYASEFVRKGRAMELLYRAGTSKAYPFCSWIPFWTRKNFPKTISSRRGERGNSQPGEGVHFELTCCQVMGLYWQSMAFLSTALQH